MEATYWICPVCGLKAISEPDKTNHKKETQKDPFHQDNTLEVIGSKYRSIVKDPNLSVY